MSGQGVSPVLIKLSAYNSYRRSTRRYITPSSAQLRLKVGLSSTRWPCSNNADHIPSASASYHVRHKCKDPSRHGAYGSSQKSQRQHPPQLCHRRLPSPSLSRHHQRPRPALQSLTLTRRLQKPSQPKPSRQLHPCPNPTLSTPSRRSRPYNTVTSQR